MIVLVRVGIACAAVLMSWPAMAGSKHAEIPSYEQLVKSLEARRVAMASDPGPAWQGATELQHAVHSLTRYWLGMPWGLGAPQTSTPQVGKVNCGTFVGTVLRDAGFRVNVKRLQRQPSQLIIKSFVSGKRVRRYSNASMERFLASVREMGPGLFIIGLDFHVGFLLQTDTELRFVHASYETRTVVDEPAAEAMPIQTSKYRVVGKILSDRNLEDWRRGRRIVVRGRW